MTTHARAKTAPPHREDSRSSATGVAGDLRSAPRFEAPRRVGSHLVREGGVEPPRPFGHTDLNRARLPIPPLAPEAGQGYPSPHTPPKPAHGGQEAGAQARCAARCGRTPRLRPTTAHDGSAGAQARCAARCGRTPRLRPTTAHDGSAGAQARCAARCGRTPRLRPTTAHDGSAGAQARCAARCGRTPRLRPRRPTTARLARKRAAPLAAAGRPGSAVSSGPHSPRIPSAQPDHTRAASHRGGRSRTTQRGRDMRGGRAA